MHLFFLLICFYEWVSQRQILVIFSFFATRSFSDVFSSFFSFFHQFLEADDCCCCAAVADDEEAAAVDEVPYEVDVDVWVIRDPSAPYEVDVVVFEDRRIASDPDNPLPLRWTGVRVLGLIGTGILDDEGVRDLIGVDAAELLFEE
jgi:hypothetical protein